VPIADISTVEVPITFPETVNVVGVTARVRLDHTFDSDLRLSLIAPTGQAVVLANQRGGGGDNYGTPAARRHSPVLSSLISCS
jgi:subtilisin-like proprotein convertase family protein